MHLEAMASCMFGIPSKVAEGLGLQREENKCRAASASLKPRLLTTNINVYGTYLAPPTLGGLANRGNTTEATGESTWAGHGRGWEGAGRLECPQGMQE